jgi:hypothetical protein
MTIKSNSQTNQTKLDINTDFEKLSGKLPVNWTTAGSINYKTYVDSLVAMSGKHSVAIEYNGDSPDVGVWLCTIPENYNGNKITLSGYIKTENVTTGWAGLFMRIGPSVAFDNMEYGGVKGTTDWKKYQITLNLIPKKTKKFEFGGLLIGNGKVWFDSLAVSIDGINVSCLTPIPINVFAAELDKEYDNGSKIDQIILDNNKLQNLNTLGLIWGFLKYYHPSIADGNYNWDYELFRILNKIIDANGIQQRDSILFEWIGKLGILNPDKKEDIIKCEIKIKPDLDWIEHSGLSENLTDLLLEVKKAKRNNMNFYVGISQMVGNPEFKNENEYPNMKFPDAGFRLLSLYRYWNIIQYFYPYKNLIGEDWKDVLKEFIPKFLEVKNELEYKLVVLELVSKVHDTHAIISNDETLRNNYGVRYSPAWISFVENRAVITNYYDNSLGKSSGLQIGDIITKINNKFVDEIVKEKIKYTPASNYPVQLRNIAPNLLRTNDTVIHIEYFRDGNPYSKSINTYSTKSIDVYSDRSQLDTCFRMVKPDIGYIYAGTLRNSYLPKIWKKIEKTKGIIVDLRCYPKEYIVFNLGEYLMPDSTEFLKVSTANDATPGLFTLTRPIKVGKENENYYKGKVIILINEVTQSQAEFTAMALRVAPNATVIGSTTAGADGDVSKIYLPGDIRTWISGTGIYYPDGRETQRVGIIPDVEVKPTILGIKKGEDEVLDKAIELITKQEI